MLCLFRVSGVVWFIRNCVVCFIWWFKFVNLWCSRLICLGLWVDRNCNFCLYRVLYNLVNLCCEVLDLIVWKKFVCCDVWLVWLEDGVMNGYWYGNKSRVGYIVCFLFIIGFWFCYDCCKLFYLLVFFWYVVVGCI